jgi:hypothetical protein
MIGENEKALIELWKELCSEHGYPQRKHFNPMMFPKLLPNIVIMERVTDGDQHDYVIRLVGTNFDDVAGENIKGRKLSSFHNKETDVLFKKNFAKLIGLPCGATFYRKNVSPRGREVGIIMTVLPFKGKTEDRPQILFYHNFEEEPWFGEGQGEFFAKPIEYWEFIDLGFGVPKREPRL